MSIRNLMSVAVLATAIVVGGSASVGRCSMVYGAMSRGPLVRPARERLPQNRSLPAVYRLGWEGAPEQSAQGELARDARMALLEAALLAADEPLTARRLADVAGLADAAEARR